MVIKDIIRKNIEEVLAIYGKHGNFTYTAEEFCKKHKYKYTDSWRRAVSRYINSLPDIDADEALREEAQSISPARVLIFDIETAPLMSNIWGLWNQNVGHNLSMLESDWFIITWSAKWLFEEEVFTGKLTPEEAKNQDDSRIVRNFWQLLNDADIVIAHNGDKFDIKRVNTRFLKLGLHPPTPYQTIDTLKHVRKKFNISSNKLDYVAKFLELGGKMETGGFELWKGCMEGDQESLNKMEEYNIKDVTLLEEVYLRIRSWITPHPNMGLHIGENVTCCATCGGTELTIVGTYKTYMSEYDALRCDSCGSINRSRASSLTTEARRLLTKSV